MQHGQAQAWSQGGREGDPCLPTHQSQYRVSPQSQDRVTQSQCRWAQAWRERMSLLVSGAGVGMAGGYWQLCSPAPPPPLTAPLTPPPALWGLKAMPANRKDRQCRSPSACRRGGQCGERAASTARGMRQSPPCSPSHRLSSLQPPLQPLPQAVCPSRARGRDVVGVARAHTQLWSGFPGGTSGFQTEEATLAESPRGLGTEKREQDGWSGRCWGLPAGPSQLPGDEVQQPQDREGPR